MGDDLKRELRHLEAMATRKLDRGLKEIAKGSPVEGSILVVLGLLGKGAISVAREAMAEEKKKEVKRGPGNP